LQQITANQPLTGQSVADAEFRKGSLAVCINFWQMGTHQQD